MASHSNECLCVPADWHPSCTIRIITANGDRLYMICDDCRIAVNMEAVAFRETYAQSSHVGKRLKGEQ